MAKSGFKIALRDMFPHASEEQLQALNEGRPVPPSKAWLEANGMRENVGEEMPVVTCIMPFFDSKRVRIARKAVNQFVAQTYIAKELIIINSSSTMVTNQAHNQIKEVMVNDPSLSVGMLRNRALDIASGSWIKQWDDDVYDPLLLAYQMGCRQSGHALLLTHQIRFHIDRSMAYMHVQPEGIPETVLFPNSSGVRYSSEGDDSETDLLLKHFRDKISIVYNLPFPMSAMQCAAYHGRSTQPIEKFLAGHHTESFNGKIMLPPAETEYLKRRLVEFGLEIRPTTDMFS